MKDEQASDLRELVTGRRAAALGTLHDGAPYVSMAPFAILSDGTGFVIHVSGLAAHTRDMLVDPRVSLLISKEEQPNGSVQALPRVTILGTARQIAVDSREYPFAREAYLARFPDAAPMFTLGDFSLFLITPTEVRWVAGFAQARTLSPVGLARAIKGTQE